MTVSKYPAIVSASNNETVTVEEEEEQGFIVRTTGRYG